MPKSKVSNNIRTPRFHADEMTQLELANLVGVSRQTIVAIEKAKYSPSLDLAFRIARVFAKKLQEVFAYEDLSNSNQTSVEGRK